MSKSVQFVIDSESHKTGVILPNEDCEEMMIDLKLALAACESSEEPHRPFEEFVKELRTGGEIDV